MKKKNEWRCLFWNLFFSFHSSPPVNVDCIKIHHEMSVAITTLDDFFFVCWTKWIIRWLLPTIYNDIFNKKYTKSFSDDRTHKHHEWQKTYSRKIKMRCIFSYNYSFSFKRIAVIYSWFKYDKLLTYIYVAWIRTN